MPSSASESCFDVVLVTYNSAEVVADALRSIPKSAKCIVVDNASSDDSAEISEALGAEVLRQGANLGFGTACNIGARAGERPYILFLNPDARLEDDCLTKIAIAFDNIPELAAANPCIRGQDGLRYSPSHAILQGKSALPALPEHDTDVVTLSGAVLAVRRAAFEFIGGFDERIFLYYEDDDLSKRLRDNGYRLRHLFEAKTVHLNGKSSSVSDKASTNRKREILRSLAYVLRKHSIADQREILGRKLRDRFVRRLLTLRISEAIYTWRLRSFLVSPHDGNPAPKLKSRRQFEK
jgi:GT2 family glycosyltransferase